MNPAEEYTWTNVELRRKDNHIGLQTHEWPFRVLSSVESPRTPNCLPVTALRTSGGSRVGEPLVVVRATSTSAREFEADSIDWMSP